MLGRRARGAAAVPAFLLVLAAGPAAAHPHVWISWRLALVFEGPRLAALDEEWLLDPQFSSMLLQDQAPGHRKGAPLTAAEVAALRDHAFANLGNYGYFTQGWAGETPLALGKARGFGASLKGDQLVYHFTLPLAAPADPKAAAVELGIWDTSYYVDLEPAEPEAGAVTLPPGSPCHAKVTPDSGRMIYYGTVTPLAVRLACP